MYGERREIPRKLIQLNKLFSASLEWGHKVHNCYLYLVDLSENGVRVCSDFPFPKEEIKIKLEMDPPLETRGKMVWQKELQGGMWTVGLKLLAFSPEEIDKIKNFMGKFSSERRKSARVPVKLNRLYPAGVEAMGYWQACFVYLIDVSEEGMRITSDFPFPIDEVTPMQLDWDKPMRLKVRALWSRKLDYSTHIIGLKFVELSEENRSIVRDLIAAANLEKNAFPLFGPENYGA